MKNVLNIGLRLTLIALLAAAALGYTNMVTKQPIADQRAAAQQLAMKQVLPQADRFELVVSAEEGNIPAEWQGRIVSASIGYAGETPVGYAVTASQKGFGGAVQIMAGIDVNGVCTGATLLTHNETPGLGAEAGKPEFIGQYTGKTAPLAVTKGTPGEDEIQAITGATITSKAVTDAVNSAAEFAAVLAEGSDGE